MLARAVTYAVVGLEPRRVEVEVDLVTAEMPAFAIVGLADRACQEAKHRVQSGVVNSLLSWPWKHRITVNLAPAALRKEGSGFDLPIALAVLAGYRQLPLERLLEHVCVGELALDGRIRPVVGTIAVAEGARRASVGRLLCAAESASEAALAGVEVVPVRHLAQAVAYLRGEEEIRAAAPPGDDELEEPSIPDLADVRGQERGRRALELAAAGEHNLLLAGPPGTGKTMLGRRMPGILPPLTRDEALEVTRIHSVAGTLPAGRPIILAPPFRAPHHGASAAAIVGGGASPRPGEVSLAHRGVLMLDELPEFPRSVLEALRQPLEDGVVSIARIGGHGMFPARFRLVATVTQWVVHPRPHTSRPRFGPQKFDTKGFAERSYRFERGGRSHMTTRQHALSALDRLLELHEADVAHAVGDERARLIAECDQIRASRDELITMSEPSALRELPEDPDDDDVAAWLDEAEDELAATLQRVEVLDALKQTIGPYAPTLSTVLRSRLRAVKPVLQATRPLGAARRSRHRRAPTNRSADGDDGGEPPTPDGEVA